MENRSLIGFKMAFSTVGLVVVLLKGKPYDKLTSIPCSGGFWSVEGEEENSSSVEYFFDPFW